MEFSTSHLLPPELAEQRAQILVADSLHIPAHPAPKTEVTIGQLNTPTDLATCSHVLLEERIEGSYCDEHLSFVDKAQPHAVYDFMAISSGPDITSNLYRHSSNFIGSVLKHVHDFATMAKADGLQPVISWSYDPYTNDRASGQGEKRFHAHFVARSPAEVAEVHDIARPLGSLDPMRQRRIADEFATVASRTLYDSLQGVELPGLTLVKPGTTEQSQFSLQLRVDEGWQTFKDRPLLLGNSLEAVDRQYHHLFESFLRDTMQGAYGDWERPLFTTDRRRAVNATLRDMVEQGQVQVDTARLIARYVMQLKPVVFSDKFVERFRRNPNDDFTAFLYPLGGISYTTCISEINGQPMVHIRPNLFTDLGGAGVALVDGVTTKVKKTKTPMTAAQFAGRQAFQHNYIDQAA